MWTRVLSGAFSSKTCGSISIGIGEWLQLVTGKALLVTIGEWASQPANGPVLASGAVLMAE